MIDERFDGPTQTPVLCPDLELCCRSDIIIKPTKDDCKVFEKPRKCGFRNEKGLGGLAVSMQNKTLYAQYAEFPWVMAIMVERNIDDKIVPVYQCGGSLIHPKVVLSSAHNIAGVNPAKLIVRGGEWNTQTAKEMCEHVEKKVARVIRHGEFINNRKFHNDLALFVLTEPFELTPFINTICLPPKNTNFDSQRCFSSGWGNNRFGQHGVRQVFLKKQILPIVPRILCQEQLRRTSLTPDFNLHEKMLCAGKCKKFI